MMFRHDLLIMCRPLGLLVVLALGLGCSRLNPAASAWTGDDLSLTVVLAKAQYLPGEPVVLRVALANATGAAQAVPALDRVAITFSVQPRLKNAIGDLKFVEPVFSGKESAGGELVLQPEGSAGSVATRDFTFTTLSFERGAYVLSATFTRPSGSPLKPARKTYAKAVLFTVAGEKAFAHRYLDGLISREDAVKLAAAQAGAPVKAAETLLITDEAGFAKWWVNVTLDGGAGVKSWFVDPYFAKVWKEARPFTAADKGVEAQPAQDAKILQNLKDQSVRSRER